MGEGLIFACYGTTDGEAYRRDLAPVAHAVASAAQGRPFVQACASPKIRRRLAALGIAAPSVGEALRSLGQRDVERIRVVPSHLVGGSTYQALVREVMLGGEGVAATVASPLVATREDARALDRVVLASHPQEERAATLLLAHGVAGERPAAYVWLQEEARALGRDDVRVVTLGDDPAQTASELLGASVCRARLVPCMLVAGHHARTQIWGSAPTAWASVLAAWGIETACPRAGLGSIPAVRQLYGDKAASR